ncbi:uncharacterized protein Z519_09242 [Cladophialophora bantiana CBS 173.52]|uniref:Uncharacterized protein n=1 Tax=Cladophialophora bantiana (strain ATCC 10958 / CBS 173.52 / CDC B-1940 / NIH 8579) TaxID=1442370 RepID=A0A0D2H957_CLAB1|nr:uncharacterized protein Z519_09242 [Cladophialophora bantiana CBS 173.52]KIW89813.1 hypothetical protein Z519_09242 [Cladophialophora bantiana CBS 173.52]
MGNIEILIAEDFENCRREFRKLSRRLSKDFSPEDCEDILFEAMDYGLAFILDSDSGDAALTSKILDMAVSKKRVRRNDTDSEGEDYLKPSKKVRMNTTKKRTRNIMKDSSDDGQIESASKKARLGG